MPSVELHGRWLYRLWCLFLWWKSALVVTLRRWLHGPRLPSWSWLYEAVSAFLETQWSAAFELPHPPDSRELVDALVLNAPVVSQVRFQPAVGPVAGQWITPKADVRDLTIYYLHGGGYVLSPRNLRNLSALLAHTARARVFALEYRLSPEFAFPSQLEDALAGYRWLLAGSVQPSRLAVLGDSAGGNLTLALLQALRAAALPQPSIAVCISPWADLAEPPEGLHENEKYDWIQKRFGLKWAGWYTRGADPCQPLISPVRADFTGLAPIYIQAGGAEILRDFVRALADHAQAQGADVTLEVWPEMVHDFQAFGDTFPASVQAVERIVQMVDERLGE
jgi:acetyl esterase/lipase